MNRPNILFFHVDNLGMGELGCYGGGVVRGAPTARIDTFARESLSLTHYIAEPQCTPSRSALLTGRHAIRSGTFAVPVGGETGGICAWERTMGDILSDEGYATACFGKWHLGSEDGRWATDHGFDEFYGPPRSYTECLWVTDPLYDPKRDPVCYMLDGNKGEPMVERQDQQMTLEVRRDCDAEYLRRSLDFMRRSVASDRPFYLYFNHSLMHLPTVPRLEFKGKSGNGEWADCLLELDHDFGVLLDELKALGVSDDTIVVFAGDNGAEEQVLWRGNPGTFEGSYFSSSEGGLRTPCIIRWAAHVAPDRVTNEMVHQVDMFPTLLRWVGAPVPDDREIDGIDQRAFFEGGQEESNREGCLVWVRDRLHGIKWKNLKVMNVRQMRYDEEAHQLTTHHVIDLATDPKEREHHNHVHLHSWITFHTRKLSKAFNESVEREPLTPFGAPLGHDPRRSS